MNNTTTPVENFPAFPVPEVGHEGGAWSYVDHQGITARDYFAAHAPDAPEWFKGPNLPRPAEPAQPEHLAKAIRQWMHDPITDLAYYTDPEHESDAWEWQKEFNDYLAACRHVSNTEIIARLAAWAYAYADAMLAARNA